MLTIIIANRNNQEYLRECLDSVLNQTYKDIEIIVTDDASSDCSPDIISGYEKKYPDIVKGILNDKCRGISENRHIGILRAKGEYITTLDSDDYYYDREKLEKEVGLVMRYRENIKQGMIFEYIMSRSCEIPRDFVMAKALYFKAGGYDFSFNLYEDWDLKIRLSRKYEFFYTGCKGTAYRRHGKGLSSAPYPAHLKALHKIYRKNRNLIDRNTMARVRKDFIKFIRNMKKNYAGGFLKQRLEYYLNNRKMIGAAVCYMKMSYYSPSLYPVKKIIGILDFS
jgi:glycosyltransferase involved in cell wall biosynthesis